MYLFKRYILLILLCILLIISGCSGTVSTLHISQETDFSFIKKVAVLPFENMSNDRFAAEIIRQAVINELLASGFVDVALPGDVTYALDRMGLKSTTLLNADQIKILGNNLKVQAVVFGSVERFGEERIGNVSAPVVTVTIMMADTESGSIIWSVTKTRGGAGFMARHFGARTDTLSETVIKVVKDAIQTLAAHAK